VQGELKIIENQRTQLESAVATTQAQAYHESAIPTQQSLSLSAWMPSPILITFLASGLLIMLGAVALLIYLTKRRARL